MSDIKIDKEIAIHKTAKGLISFSDKLVGSPVNKYAQIHAKDDDNDMKRQSLIGIWMQDYSKGTGDNNVKVMFNIDPKHIKFLHERARIGHKLVNYSKLKIFGNATEKGYSIVTKIDIQRKDKTPSGELYENPWSITIENGIGQAAYNKFGGIYCKSGTYICHKKASINMTDIDFFTLMDDVVTYINLWENIIGRNTIIKAFNLLNNNT